MTVLYYPTEQVPVDFFGDLRAFYLSVLARRPHGAPIILASVPTADTWQLLGTSATAIGAVLSLLLTIANRTRILRFFVGRVALEHRINTLASENGWLRTQANAAQSAATSWREAAHAGVFTRAEATELIARVDRLEHRNASLVGFARAQIAYASGLETALASAGVRITLIPPPIPLGFEQDFP
jgi:hypothetical protein